MPAGDACIRKWVVCATKGCGSANAHGNGIGPPIAIVLFIVFVVGISLGVILKPMKDETQVAVFSTLIWMGAIGGTLMLLILRIIDPGTLRANSGPPDAATADMLQAAGIAGHNKFSETITREQIDEKGNKYEARYCITCHLWRTQGASHCSECGHCVEKLDHHCGATGVCIAKSNLRFFLAFLFFTGLGGSTAFAACVARLVELEFWTSDPWSLWDPYLCLVFGLMFINCLNLLGFFVVTCINALYGETYKEQLKARENQPLSPPKTAGQLWRETCRPTSWIRCWHEVLCLSVRRYVPNPKPGEGVASLRRDSKKQTLMDDLVPALTAEQPTAKEDV